MSRRHGIFIVCILIGLLTSLAFAREAEPVGVLSAAPKSFLLEEPYVRQCQLGSAVADAVRAAGNTDVALVNTGDLANDLNSGAVTRADVEHMFTEDRPLATARLSPEALRAILEHSVSRVTVDHVTEQVMPEESRFDGFCQVSGIRFQYDATAPAGERILSVSREDGSPLAETVTVCAAAYMLDGGYGYSPVPREALGMTLADAVESYIRGHTSFPSSDRVRITAAGIRVPMLGTGITRGTLFAGCLVFMGFLVFYRMRRKAYQEEYARTEEEKELDVYARAATRPRRRR